MQPSVEIPILSFATAREWNSWLDKNSGTLPGVWLRFFKKNSGIKSITYDEALDEALCYGWIDSQLKTYDEQSYLQKFTPRRERSIWSKRNRDHIERLLKSGRMKPPGIEQVTLAKKDGRWVSAYDSPTNSDIPDDFLKELSKDPKAESFFKSLNKANTYAIAWRLQTAKKPETRSKRMQTILAMLKKGEKFH